MNAPHPPTCGFMYIATGERLIAEAITSARSIRRVMPALPITLVSDRPCGDPVFDRVELIAEPSFSGSDKVRNITRAPYDRCAYVDSDTYLCADISELFDLLDQFDLLVAHDTERTKTYSSALPRAFPEMNCGFIVFNRASVDPFLREWQAAYEADVAVRGVGCSDQRSFRATLFASRLRFYVLPPEYHCMLWEASVVCGTVTLLHGRHHMGLQQLSADVNTSGGNRVFKAGLGCHQVNLTSQLLAWAGKVLWTKARVLATNPRRVIDLLRPPIDAQRAGPRSSDV